jgi:hypothetical protein
VFYLQQLIFVYLVSVLLGGLVCCIYDKLKK